MKTFLIDKNYSDLTLSSPDNGDKGNMSWYFIADSALSNAGKPFFLPPTEIKTAFGIALRIGRLGKTISRKFSLRYVDAIAPIVNFRMTEEFQKLQKENLSVDPAVSFDKAVFYGSFVEIEEKNMYISFDLAINSEPIDSIKLEVNKIIELVIPKISKYNTLKIGDLIIPGLSDFHNLSKGDKIEIRDNGENILSIKIK